MKHSCLIPLTAVALMLTACHSIKYTSQDVLQSELYKAEQQMETQGYKPVGRSTDVAKDPLADYLIWSNQNVYFDTRRFVDADGNTAVYTVRYNDFRKGVINVSLASCDVSSPADYHRVCGYNGVANRFDNVPRDKHKHVRFNPRHSRRHAPHMH